MPGELPSPCYGLIQCTPIPTLAPTGVTHAEALVIADIYSTLLIFAIFVMAFVFLLGFSLAVLAATKGRS